MTEKEYLYVGHYTDTNGNYILKIGTTNDLDRRQKEHTRNYRKAPQYVMPSDQEFQYDFWLKLSKYNPILNISTPASNLFSVPVTAFPPSRLTSFSTAN